MQRLGDAIKATDLFKQMEKRDPELAKKCREEFQRGYEDGLRRSGTGSYPGSSSSSRPGGPSGKRPGLPVVPTMIESDSPLKRPADLSEILPVILRISLATGHTMSKDRQQVLARVLMDAKWTAQEIEYAEHAILTSRDLLKEISFERTIGPGVFASARETPEVRRGRLHARQEAVAYARSLISEQESRRGIEPKPVSELFEVARLKDNPKEIYWLLK